MRVRMRITVTKPGSRTDDLRIAANLRRTIWAHSPVEIDLKNPLHGTHCDRNGRAYFEFATEYPDKVRQVVDQQGYADQVELKESHERLEEECQNCGNIPRGSEELPTVCPNCGFRDISACPACQREIPRQQYTCLAGDLFRCPHCHNHVRLRFNSPMFLADGSYNQPLVVVDEVAAHHEV